MRKIKKIGLYIDQYPWPIYFFVLLLLIPALFLNLGLYPFNLDEATRAVVALEMKFSGNYFTPTINGELYLNKPPLFNWIQLFFVSLTGSMEEWVFRIPVVLSLLGFGLTIFLTLKKDLGKQVALMTALAVITSGRILFYDSFKGLIDISFSWVMYANFLVIFNNLRKGSFSQLFILSWLLTSAGFLLKGLPSLVFQGITLTIAFIVFRSFRKLFSLSHIPGLLCFIILVGGYLVMYNQGSTFSQYLSNLWNESAKRTAIDNSSLQTFRHILVFPFEFILNFLPWTILVVLVVRKDFISVVKSHLLLKYLGLIFFGNILVYWISPAIYPRYLFMFLPPFLAIFWFVFFRTDYHDPVRKYFFRPLASGIIIVFPLGVIASTFFLKPSLYSFFWIKIAGLFILSILMAVGYFKFKAHRLIILFGFLLLARTGFNLFVFHDRLESGIDAYQKEQAIQAAIKSMGKPLYLYRDCPIHNTSTFHIERIRQETLKRSNDWMEEGNQYIVKSEDLDEMPAHRIISEFETNLWYLKLSIIEPE